MKVLKYAQDLIKTRNSSVAGGFNSFIMGYDQPKPNDHHDYGERIQGYDYAESMAKDGKIAFTYKFKCECGGYPFQYGGFWVCNSCGGRDVNEDWWIIIVEKDGNEYCCHGLDFTDLQESNNYAFGKTFKEAIKNYGNLMTQLKQQ